MDYQAVLYDPIYNSLGVLATLTSSGGVTATVRVLDKTAGVAIDDPVKIETIVPAAKVRVVELTENDIALTDLPQGQITFNGSTWRIKSYKPMPSPNGESDGQALLILLDEG